MLSKPAPEHPLMHDGTADVFEGLPAGASPRGDEITAPIVGYAEGHEAGRIIEAPIDTARLGMMFDHLRAGALNPAESARFIDSLYQG